MLSTYDGPDAFIHVGAVDRAGLPHLTEGQRVEVDMVQNRRGGHAADNLKPVV